MSLMRNSYGPRPFILAVLFVLVCFSAAQASQKGLVLGVHPYLPATEIMERFTPLAEYLGREVARPVTIDIAKNYQDHIDRVGNEEVDIAFMGPSSYVLLVEHYGERPLLGRLEVSGRPVFFGVIITSRDSPVTSLSGLKGRRFAFGDPDSTMSTLVPRYLLWQEGVSLDDLGGYSFMSNHDNVALGVLVGEFDAGAVKDEVYRKYKGRGLRVLSKTPEISEHLFVVSRRLSAGTVELLRKAMLRLGQSDAGKRILKSIKSDVTGIVPVTYADYENLREIMLAIEKMGDAPR